MGNTLVEELTGLELELSQNWPIFLLARNKLAPDGQFNFDRVNLQLSNWHQTLTNSRSSQHKRETLKQQTLSFHVRDPNKHALTATVILHPTLQYIKAITTIMQITHRMLNMIGQADSKGDDESETKPPLIENYPLLKKAQTLLPDHLPIQITEMNLAICDQLEPPEFPLAAITSGKTRARSDARAESRLLATFSLFVTRRDSTVTLCSSANKLNTLEELLDISMHSFIHAYKKIGLLPKRIKKLALVICLRLLALNSTEEDLQQTLSNTLTKLKQQMHASTNKLSDRDSIGDANAFLESSALLYQYYGLIDPCLLSKLQALKSCIVNRGKFEQHELNRFSCQQAEAFKQVYKKLEELLPKFTELFRMNSIDLADSNSLHDELDKFCNALCILYKNSKTDDITTLIENEMPILRELKFNIELMRSFWNSLMEQNYYSFQDMLSEFRTARPDHPKLASYEAHANCLTNWKENCRLICAIANIDNQSTPECLELVKTMWPRIVRSTSMPLPKRESQTCEVAKSPSSAF